MEGCCPSKMHPFRCFQSHQTVRMMMGGVPRRCAAGASEEEEAHHSTKTDAGAGMAMWTGTREHFVPYLIREGTLGKEVLDVFRDRIAQGTNILVQ